MIEALATLLGYIKRIPPAWRGPVALLSLCVLAVGGFIYSRGYETQMAHAADIKAVRDEMNDTVPGKTVKMLIEALDLREAARAKPKKRKAK